MTRVYLPSGKRAHQLAWDGSPNLPDPALCGLQPLLFASWYGTGTQAEIDRAATLPLCRRCERRQAPPRPAQGAAQ